MATETKRMLQFIDQNASYVNANPYLYRGELAFESDSGQLKVGADTAWSGTNYFNPAIMKEVSVTGSTLSVSATHCGSLIHVRNASSFTLTVNAGDLADSDTPAGITTHFPNRGYFYLQFDHDVTSVTTFTVTAGADCNLWINEFGASVALTSTNSRNMNDTDLCQGKLYLFINLGGTSGRWQVYEMDTKDVWNQAQVATEVNPSYGGAARPTAWTYGAGTEHTILYTSALPSNAGVATTGYASGILSIVDDGVYRVYGQIICSNTVSLTDPALSVIVNGVEDAASVTSLIGTFNTAPYAIFVDTLIDITAVKSIWLRLTLGASASPKIDAAQFSVEKLNINVAG